MRTVRLVIMSLAVVGAVFGLYQLSVEPIESRTVVVELPEVHEQFLRASMNENRDTSPGIEIDGVPVSGGDKSEITILDDDLRKKMRIESAGWRQVDESGRRFQLTDPIITFYLAKGQTAKVRSDSAMITSRTRDKLDARQGTLSGNVLIVFDQTTDRWRAEHEEDAKRPTPQSRLIRLWVDQIEFDMDLGRLTTDGPVRIESATAALEGIGLTVRWSETSGRIESLKIERGKSLMFEGSAGLGLDVSGEAEPEPPGQDLLAPPSVASAESPVSDAAKTRHAGTGTIEPTVIEKEDVLIIRRGRSEPQEASLLNTYHADFSDNVVARQFVEHREEGRLSADRLELLFDVLAASIEPANTTGTSDTGEPSGEDAPDVAKTAVRKVHVTWTGPLIITTEQIDSPADGQARRHLTATGTPVVLENQDGRATCAEFEHHMESDFTRFFGRGDQPAVIEAGSGRRMEARDLITLNKSDRMVQLRGEVKISHDEFRLESEKVDALFGEPRKGSGRTALPDLLEQLKCYGDVVATQDSRRITASKNMLLTFSRMPRPANGGAGDTSPRIETLKAEGQVTVRDEVRGLDVAGEKLTCKFDDRQVITEGYIEGQAGQHAHVRNGEYFIEGRIIEFDEQREWVYVPGAGAAEFTLSEDLDGRRSDKPVRVRVTWQNKMKLQGQDDMLTFDGNVVAKSDNITLRSATQRITLTDVEPDPDTGTQVASTDPLGAWFLRPYEAEAARTAKFFGSEPKQPNALAGRFNKRARYILADGNAELQSRNDQGNTGALRSRLTLQGPQIAFDLDARVMIVDHPGLLFIEDYQIDAAAHRGPRAGDAPQRGLFQSLRSGGPSQTKIVWDFSMRYYFDQRVAEFNGKDEPVWMRHLSGSHIGALDLVAKDTGVDRALLDQLAASGSGRRADLTCGQLFVVFGEPGTESDRGAGEMSIGELSEVHANRNVLLTEKDSYQLTGDRLDYFSERDLIEVYGSTEDRAYLDGTNPKTRRMMDLECERISIELETWRHYGRQCRGRSIGR